MLQIAGQALSRIYCVVLMALLMTAGITFLVPLVYTRCIPVRIHLSPPGYWREVTVLSSRGSIVHRGLNRTDPVELRFSPEEAVTGHSPAAPHHTGAVAVEFPGPETSGGSRHRRGDVARLREGSGNADRGSACPIGAFVDGPVFCLCCGDCPIECHPC